MKAMSQVRERAEQLLVADASYREEIEFVRDSIAGNMLFFGQSESGPLGKPDHVYWVSVGMFQNNMPEITMCGVPAPFAREIAEQLFVGGEAEREFLAGKTTRKMFDLEVMAVPIDHPAEHTELWICRDYYSLNDMESLQVVQLVFADSDGKFPWSDDTSDEDRYYQKILGFNNQRLSLN